jgi:hypothetical protein
METLEQELNLLIDKLNNANNFNKTLDEINSTYPFSKYEGQIMITNTNIDSINNFMVESRTIRQAIIEQYES